MTRWYECNDRQIVNAAIGVYLWGHGQINQVGAMARHECDQPVGLR